MALELAAILAGFPLAASFAIAGGITVLREGRRRASLNEAVHELRRPLQALALSLPADGEVAGALDSSMRLAAAAVDRLDREINGRRVPGARTSISVRPVVEAAVGRWQARANLAGRSLSLCWRACNPLLRGDGLALDQAMDNMISNAFEHGSGEITVEVRESGDVLRLLVLDGGGRVSASHHRCRRSLWARLSGRSRHGHGLRIVRRTAARHGGSFQLLPSPLGTEARLELPLGGEVR